MAKDGRVTECPEGSGRERVEQDGELGIKYVIMKMLFKLTQPQTKACSNS